MYQWKKLPEPTKWMTKKGTFITTEYTVLKLVLRDPVPERTCCQVVHVDMRIDEVTPYDVILGMDAIVDLPLIINGK